MVRFRSVGVSTCSVVGTGPSSSLTVSEACMLPDTFGTWVFRRELGHFHAQTVSHLARRGSRVGSTGRRHHREQPAAHWWWWILISLVKSGGAAGREARWSREVWAASLELRRGVPTAPPAAAVVKVVVVEVVFVAAVAGDAWRRRLRLHRHFPYDI